MIFADPRGEKLRVENSAEISTLNLDSGCTRELRPCLSALSQSLQALPAKNLCSRSKTTVACVPRSKINVVQSGAGESQARLWNSTSWLPISDSWSFLKLVQCGWWSLWRWMVANTASKARQLQRGWRIEAQSANFPTVWNFSSELLELLEDYQKRLHGPAWLHSWLWYFRAIPAVRLFTEHWAAKGVQLVPPELELL